ncbi:MAG: hypothetical protein K2F83_07010, partial [Oscillospiraceae bacterium]|nr:hypothetical protein [Oscillospiraceae bacterium]
MGENRDNMRQAMKELLGLVGFGPEEGSSKPEQAEQARPAAAETVTATRTATVERPKVEPIPEQPKPKVEEKPAVAQATDLEDTQKKVATTVERSFFGFGKEKEKEKAPVFGEVKVEEIPETKPYFVDW